MSVTVRAAAKINLHLGVGAPRDDGFHPLCTVYQAISLYDDVTATADDVLGVRTTAASPRVEVVGVPDGPDHLAHRAAVALGRHHGRDLTAALTVDKAIPVAGGLAGGSADAAAALVALDRLHDLRTTDDDLLRLAADLGSDVPFSLLGGTALGTGRGELVEPVADTGPWWWVVVPATAGLATPGVYAHLDRLRPDADPTPTPADAVLAALTTGEPAALARALHNDLEAAAVDLRPELGALLDRGVAEGALRGLVSGSGPTVLFLAESAEHARAVAGALEGALVAHGPVAGAHVVVDRA
ncbi:4-(cytidine 5'-diphospho)-2-C-methyl-D-erythritol kinase [Nocardioides marinquilinus]|uniref:4-diphosphocytidyl-2-C-methyl-D-erythritol kinase n=1 Tax=Nocardioides marinquilinus TaxID=1210400 RepID=A0ABP9PFA5_9ACTN